MTQRSVLFRELRAPELRALAGSETVVIIPVASIEQHGPHLPVGTDSILGAAVCKMAAEQMAQESPVLVTDTIWTGLSEHHMAFGATITLDFQTFMGVIRGVVQSLARHGFRKIALINSHGGNVAALQTVTEELTREFSLPIVAATYWTLAAPKLAPHLQTQKGIRHACEAETAMIMALCPELVDEAALEHAGHPDMRDVDGGGQDDGYRWMSFAEKTPTGVLGSPKAATPEQGRKLLEIASAHLAERLQDRSFWGPREAAS